MKLPASIHPDALRTRIVQTLELARQEPSVPEWVCESVQSMLDEFSQTDPELEFISLKAHGILRWSYDQGFIEIPAHAALSSLALDCSRLGDIVRSLSQLNLIMNPPEWICDLKQILEMLQASYSTDGCLDSTQYDQCLPALNDLVRLHRDWLEQNTDHSIFRI